LNNPEFEIQEIENEESVPNGDHKLSQMQETENNVEALLNNERQATLTQITDDSDDYY